MVDFDSTLNAFDAHFTKTLNAKFGTSYRVEDMTDWDWVRRLPQDQGDYVWGNDCFGNRHWTAAIPPAPGGILAVHRLLDAGYHVVVLSSRPWHHGQWLRDWLDDKGLLKADAWVEPMKLIFAQERGVALAFEDSPLHAVSLATHCPVYLVDHPWNQDVAGDNITRTQSLWTAVEDMGL